jgi:hypothetical protein
MAPMKHFTGIIALVVVGCAEAPAEPEEGETPDIVAFGKPIEDCEEHVCGGGNSPRFGVGRVFHELHLQHGVEQFSGHGYMINTVMKGNASCQLKVSRAKVTALCSDSPIEVSGAGLANLLIHISSTIGTPEHYILKFGEEGFAGYWPDPTRKTPWYKVYWSLPMSGGGTWKNLCSGGVPDRRNAMGLPADSLVMFEGERIDPREKTIYDIDLTGNWINVGCAGNGPTKMHVAGHSYAATKLAFPSTVAQRQTLLKLNAAAYCGRIAYTIHNQPSDYRDEPNTLPYVFPIAQLGIEARWNASGATCLSIPRVLANPSKEANDYFPNVMTTIQNECKLRRGPNYVLPACQGSPQQMDGHFFVSANPL